MNRSSLTFFIYHLSLITYHLSTWKQLFIFCPSLWVIHRLKRCCLLIIRRSLLGISHFIVEDVRSARRFLKKVDREIDIDTLTFYPLNKHTSPEDISGYLKPLMAGLSMGVISEAGCPAVADPGADVVAIAQRKNLKVVPLVGPSSIILSVMGSGFNGQSFAFHGYLPIEPGERAKKIRTLEQRVYAEHQTQLFIETPYRNNKMVEDILQNCRPQTKLCIAANITCEGEYIKTKTSEGVAGKSARSF